ncbi:hypothetical protein AB4Y45_04405 [Paraburkholderia sp. EG287A]|uniref:hypothetical protein n=1 Tax=unclassified Paraburkholderia TaxID=2615204 RepID=UPI0034D34FCF
MVVVSWNMAKSRNIPFDQVLKDCERWGTSLLVIQEPTGSLRDFGSRRKESQPRGCESSWRGHLHESKGSSQGDIVIISREGVVVSNVKGVDVNVGQGTYSITRTNPLVVFDAQEDRERMKIATCHAPFDIAARSAYAVRAINAAQSDGVHCVIGDMNTYGTRTPGASRSRNPSNYQTPSLGATSAKGSGSPLDKAYVSNSIGNSFQAGRIIPGSSSRRVMPSPGGSDQVSDIVDPDWRECQSDHLPIYIAFHDDVDRIRGLFRRGGDDDDSDDDGSPPSKRQRLTKGTHRPIKT